MLCLIPVSLNGYALNSVFTNSCQTGVFYLVVLGVVGSNPISHPYLKHRSRKFANQNSAEGPLVLPPSGEGGRGAGGY